MTALPATRQECDKLFAKIELHGFALLLWSDNQKLLALARRGAETVGATEAWEVGAKEVPEHWLDRGRLFKHESDARHDAMQLGPWWCVRRCLILPENE